MKRLNEILDRILVFAASAEAVSKEIESIPINPDNPNMVQLKERAENGTI